MSVRLHIEELVLHGVASADGHHIADAVRAELERRLTGRSQDLARLAGPAAVPIDRLDAGSVAIADGARPASVGARVGGAIASALSGVRP